MENFIPPLLDAVLLDYQRTAIPDAREPEVLSTMATIVNKLGSHITSEVPKIFDAVFECTLDMINKDFEEYPEHRTNFFLLLQVSFGIKKKKKKIRSLPREHSGKPSYSYRIKF